MKSSVIAFSVALAAASGWAGWEDSLRTPWLYSSTFEEYALGEALTNGTVVSGGAWTVPQDAETFATVTDERYCMSYMTSSAKGIILKPTSMDSANDKAVAASMKLTGYETLPELEAKDRAALIIYAPSNADPTFQGWSANGWQTLTMPSGMVKPVAGEWYDIMIRLMTDGTGRTRVQYRLAVGAEYEPLRTEDGRYWLEVVGNAPVVKEVEVRGAGSFEYMKGSEMKSGLVVGVSQRK